MADTRDLTSILAFASEQGASDIVITRGSPVAFKLNGRWNQVNAEPLAGDATQTLIYSGLTQPQIARLERDRELDWSFEYGGATRVRFRGNAFFQRGAVGAVLRLVPREVPTPAELGLPPALESLAGEPQGLILITGPTGQGKTTTAAALIDSVNRNRRCHIVTVEDPIEYIHRNKNSIVEQREVGDDTPSFASALRRVLRQAPDVIMIGEMRDLETISAALTAAETGHLVLATLHTNDAVKTVDRILDSYPTHQQSQVRAQLALALTAVVSQRLIPRSDGKGRVLAAELLINTTAVANLIREQKIYQIYSVLDTSSKDGMITMDASLKRLFAEGKISIAEAKSRMKNPNSLGAADAAPGRPGIPPPSAGQPGGGFSGGGTTRIRRTDVGGLGGSGS